MNIILECENAIEIDGQDFEDLKQMMLHLTEKYDCTGEIRNFNVNYNLNKEEE